MLNACELEIDLFCRGLQIPPGLSLQGARGISRTRAGLGSGLELILPTGSKLKPRIWMNAPVMEPFAQTSPYVLEGEPASAYWIRDSRTDDYYRVELPQEPVWYQRFTSRDVPMSQIGVLQGTYLGIYINAVCAFWHAKPALNCKFCTTGRNVGHAELATKSVDDVVETCWAAKEESGITFVHFNGGYQGRHALKEVEPYIKAVKEQVGLLVGVQLTPDRDLSEYDRLVDLGVDHLSFCLEFLDPEWFAKICPGKAKTLGQALFFEAMEHSAKLLPRGAISGEIIAGIEPVENTIGGIERIVSSGAFPTVCIFRPTVGSEMAGWPSPAYEDMRRVMVAMYETCRRHRMPIGIAPNIEVSLVVTPDDAALLASRTAGFYGYELWRRTLRTVARPAFASRLRTRH